MRMAMVLSAVAAGVASLTVSVAPASAHSPVATAVVSLASEKCLDVAGSSVAPGTAVNQFACHGGPNQRWRAREGPVAGYVAFVNERSGQCLDDPSGGATPGKLQQFPCHQGDNQLFRLEPVDDELGGLRIVSRRSGKCLDVPNGQPEDGLRIQEFDCHMGVSQRFLHAAPAPSRHEVAATRIGHVVLNLRAGTTYAFRLERFPVTVVPEMHLWSATAGEVAFAGRTTSATVRMSYAVPAGRSGEHQLFLFAQTGSRPATGSLTVTAGSAVVRSLAGLPLGGTAVPAAAAPGPGVYQTALVPGGAEDTVLLALGADGGLVGWDDDGGVGKASRISRASGARRLVVGILRGNEGPAAIYVNDVSDDHDGDGLGRALENRLGTCDSAMDHPRCAFVANPRDSDRDGLEDAAEVFGVDAPSLLVLPRWGASPVHKDVFVEVDSVGPRIALTEGDAESIRDLFRAGRIRDIRNPDAERGIAVHLDLGFEPVQAANAGLFGNWGGSNAIPPGGNPSGQLAAGRGGFFYGSSDSSGARTLVHELGHALNLAHEGGSNTRPLSVNCSVIHPSIMSYAGQLASGPWGAVGFHGGDFEGLRLNPTRLCEADGLSGRSTAHLSAYGLAQSQTGPGVDWNRDHSIEPCSRPVRARLNWSAEQGCDTHVQGRFANNDNAALAVGGSPSLARMGDFLYLFYVTLSGRIGYRWGRQGQAFAPTAGCSLGMSPGKGPEGGCSDWRPADGTPETATISSLRAFSTGGRMYLAYTRPGVDPIQVRIAGGQDADGRLRAWSAPADIPQSRADQAPALGLLYRRDLRGRLGRWLTAAWPDRMTRELEIAYADLDTRPEVFLQGAPPRNEGGARIATNGTSVSLAFWGKDDGAAADRNQTWMALAGGGDLVRLFVYDAQADVFRDRTAAAFAVPPPEPVNLRMGFAYRPLLDADGAVLDPFTGEFTLVHVKGDGLVQVRISEVTTPTRPPDRNLEFRQVMSGRLGHPFYLAATAGQGGADLFAGPGFPFLRGALVRPNGTIDFLAYADGVFDMELSAVSDFKVMERGLCLGLRGESFCGPPNAFGY